MVAMVNIAAKFVIALLLHFRPNSRVSATLLPLVVNKGKLQIFGGIHCMTSISVFTKIPPRAETCELSDSYDYTYKSYWYKFLRMFKSLIA
jgi:hypothetical protein